MSSLTPISILQNKYNCPSDQPSRGKTYTPSSRAYKAAENNFSDIDNQDSGTKIIQIASNRSTAVKGIKAFKTLMKDKNIDTKRNIAKNFYDRNLFKQAAIAYDCVLEDPESDLADIDLATQAHEKTGNGSRAAKLYEELGEAEGTALK